jgi:hypothetical protein
MLDVFRTCVRCSVWRAANTALLEATGGLATPSVFLVSDDKSTLVGTVGDSDSDLFPTNMVSSPLQLADNVPSVNSESWVSSSCMRASLDAAGIRLCCVVPAQSTTSLPSASATT